MNKVVNLGLHVILECVEKLIGIIKETDAELVAVTNRLEHLERKVAHGCTGTSCKECDNVSS